MAAFPSAPLSFIFLSLFFLSSFCDFPLPFRFDLCLLLRLSDDDDEEEDDEDEEEEEE